VRVGGVVDGLDGAESFLDLRAPALGGRVGVVLPVTNQLSVRVRADVLRDLSPTTLTVAGTFPWTATAVAGSLGIDGVVRF